MSTSHIAEDSSVLSYVDRLLYRFETVLALISGLAIFLLMVLAVVSVGGRELFSTPLSGYVDWIEQIMPLIAVIGIAYCQRLGGHIRMDIVISKLPARPLYALEAVATLCILLLVILLIWGSASHFARSFDLDMPNFSTDSSLDIGIPLWPAKLLVPLALSVLALRLVLQLWGYLAALITNKAIAVPVPQDAVTQAADEAAHVSSLD